MNKEQQIRVMITTILANKGDNAPFSDEDSLVYSGRLRSMDIIELASMIEDQFHIDFADIGFNQYDFDSVQQLCKLIS